MSLLAPAGWHTDHDVLFRQPVLTEAGTERVMISLPVASLSEALLAIPTSGARLEHVYDF